MIKGIKIATTNCGIKYKNRDDLLFVAFDEAVNVAGVFTQSSMPAAPVVWCKKSLATKKARALVVNAGNANAFTGQQGEEVVEKTAEKVCEILSCHPNEVFISSTGVIGETLNHQLITQALPQMAQNFSANEDAFLTAAKAIMTTDTKEKIIKKTCKIADKEVTIIGFAKGSGMIAPNMATMLGYIFTDANIEAETLQEILGKTVNKSFNSITVDSDQSTNDTVLLFATAAAQNQVVASINDSHAKEFLSCLNEVALALAKMIVIDGEGAKKLIEIEVSQAQSQAQAKFVAFAIANSPLVKTAIAGADPNWGRIVMAVGKSCAETSPQKIIVKIGDYILTENGAKHPNYVEKTVHEYLKGSEVKIHVSLGIGEESDKVWTCDLNEEYIKINKDYRS